MNIRLSNLHLSYGQRHVLDGVSLGPLERGTVTGLLGPQRSGKIHAHQGDRRAEDPDLGRGDHQR